MRSAGGIGSEIIDLRDFNALVALLVQVGTATDDPETMRRQRARALSKRWARVRRHVDHT
jgi:hypothetical protein